MVFVSLTFPFNLFNSNAFFLVSSISFYLLTNAIPSTYSNSSGHSDLISLDSAFRTLTNKECSNTET